MTVNERQFSAQLLNAYDDAARNHDWSEMRRLLLLVDITPSQTEEIVQAIKDSHM